MKIFKQRIKSDPILHLNTIKYNGARGYLILSFGIIIPKMKNNLLVLLVAITVTSLFNTQKLLAQNSSPYWSLAGNSNATSTSKLGTTNAINLRIVTNNVERIRVSTAGNIGIGTTSPLYKLHVVGNAIITTGLRVSDKGINATNAAGIGVLGVGTTYGIYGTSTTAVGQGFVALAA